MDIKNLYKIGVEDILVDPKDAPNLHTFSITALTAEKLSIYGEPLMDFIYRRHMGIYDVRVTIYGNEATITWKGAAVCSISARGVTRQNKQPNTYTMTLPAGMHEVEMLVHGFSQAYYTGIYMGAGAKDGRYDKCLVTVQDVGKHSFSIGYSDCGGDNLSIVLEDGRAFGGSKPIIVDGLDAHTSYKYRLMRDKQLIADGQVTTDDLSAYEKALLAAHKPIINAIAPITISDQMSVGDLVAVFTYDSGGIPLVDMQTLGEASEYVKASMDGKIFLIKAVLPGFGTQTLAGSIAISNDKGTTTTIIQVDASVNAPTIAPATIVTTENGQVAGALVATMNVDAKGFPITSIVLPSSISTYYSIANDGKVTEKGIILDYENAPTGWSDIAPAGDGTKQKQVKAPVQITTSQGTALAILTITLRDMDDNPPVWSTDTAFNKTAVSIAENVAVGAALGQYKATGATAWAVDDTVSFAIDAAGNLVTNTSFDYESGVSHNVTVTATNPYGSISKMAVVTVTDVDDIPTINGGSTFTIAENQPVGTLLGQVAFNAKGATPTFTVSDTTNFAVDASGKVTTKKSFDYESGTTTYTPTITITTPYGTANAAIVVNVTDVLDTPPTISNGTATFQENNATGSTVATMTFDAKGAAPTFTSSDAGFAVSTSGVVTTTKVFDYESDPHSYTPTITITTVAGSATATLTVTLTDDTSGAEAPPSFAQASVTKAIAENNAVGSTVHTQLAGGAGYHTYSISAGDTAKFEVNATTAEVKTKYSFNYEVDAHSFPLTIKATNNSTGATDTYTLNVNITDVTTGAGEIPPTLAVDVGTVSKLENRAPEKLFTFTADWQGSSKVSFALSNTTDFELKNETATTVEVWSKRAFDFEVDFHSYTIGVNAVNSIGTTTTLATYKVLDVAEANPPKIYPANGLTMELSDHAVGSALDVVYINDDGGAAITAYELEDANGLMFKGAGVIMSNGAFEVVDDSTVTTAPTYITIANAVPYLPTVKQDATGGLNDYVTRTVRMRAKNSAGWGPYVNATIKIRNKAITRVASEDTVGTGSTKTSVDVIGHYIYQGRDVSMLNLDGVSTLRKLTNGIQTDGGYGGATDTNKSHNFNQDIGRWNTSAVTDLSYVFHNARSFNQPVGFWNTSAATSTQHAFYIALAFNQPLNDWYMGNVRTIDAMFNLASAFNQPLNAWNTGSATNMSNMFDGAGAFNQNISGWNVGNVTGWTNFRTGGCPLSTPNTPPKFR